MIDVSEVMTPEPYTLTEDDSLKKARDLMLKKHIRHVPIVDANGVVVGVVSHRDVLAASQSILLDQDQCDRDEYDHQVTLSSIMTKAVRVVDVRDSLLSAAIYLKKQNHDCLPVVDGADRRIVGILSSSDLLDLAIQSLESSEQHNEGFEEMYFSDDEGAPDLVSV